MEIKKIILYIFLITSIIRCENAKQSDNYKNFLILRFVINSALQNVTTTTTTNTSQTSCSNVVASTFSDLQKGLNQSPTVCSSCHGSIGPSAGFDSTSYSQVVQRITLGNASSSLLYQKINGGSMTSYANATTRSVVFCWIQNGAKN